MSEGRYAERTGNLRYGDIAVWYFDRELYGNWIFKSTGYDSEFRARFLGRNWEVKNVSYRGWQRYLCFEARSLRRGSSQTIRYCNARTPLGANGEVAAYDRTIVENIMANGGLYKP